VNPMASLLLASVVVTLPGEIRVAGTELRLGDVAGVEGEAELARRVASVSLGYAPAPGYSRLLQAARLEREIERKCGVDVRLAGETTCRVHPLERRIEAEALRAAAEEELTGLLVGLDASFEQRGNVGPVVVPEGREGVELVARFRGRELRSGTLDLPVEVRVDGVTYRTVWTSWQVDLWETRQVLKREVRAGETLTPDLFERRRVRVDRRVGEQPLPGTAVLGSVAARDLRSSETVSALDVHRPLVVLRGATVYLQVRKGAITARVPALAQDAGAVGDRIRVMAMNSSREMSAVIVGRDQVELDLGVQR